MPDWYSPLAHCCCKWSFGAQDLEPDGIQCLEVVPRLDSAMMYTVCLSSRDEINVSSRPLTSPFETPLVDGNYPLEQEFSISVTSAASA